MAEVRNYLFSLPDKINPETLYGESSIFHFDIEGSGKYTLHLNDGDLSVKEGLEGDPRCIVTTQADVFGKLVSKELNPMMAMMTGKLKISNPGEMLKYAKVFGLV
ncbi:MAG: SCP2 sterol-binding domain-containing protein [Saprospiraceae bacterium]|jgi:putative sterol carrier protein